MSNGQLGFGAQLFLGGSVTNTATYVAVAHIEDVTAPKRKVASVGIDTHDGPTFNGLPVEDNLPGYIDRGAFQVKTVHVKAQYATLEAALGIPNWLKFIMADGGGFICQGYIDELGPQTPLKDKMTAEMSIKLNGTNTGAFSTTQT